MITQIIVCNIFIGYNENVMLLEYLPIFIFLVFALIFATIMLGIGFTFGPHDPDIEKNSPYECGFEAFEDTRMKFDIRYYLVAILFIIFDLEIAFLFPWAISLGSLGALGFWSMMFFLGVLTIGFIYEWKKGSFEW